jgi:hypothetical protein
MYGSPDMEIGGFGSPFGRKKKPGIMSILQAMATK